MAPAGIVIVLIKIPLARVDVSPEVTVSVVVVSYLKERLVLAGKLAPDTATAVPAGPDEGSSGSSMGTTGAVTVRVVLAIILVSVVGLMIVI